MKGTGDVLIPNPGGGEDDGEEWGLSPVDDWLNKACCCFCFSACCVLWMTLFRCCCNCCCFCSSRLALAALALSFRASLASLFSYKVPTLPSSPIL